MHTLRWQAIVVASHNAGKLREIADLIAPFGLEARSAAEFGLPEPDETGTTFEENAYIKAHAAAVATGLPALSDDSGLCADALDGEPGVYTANWAETPDGKRDFGIAMQKVEDLLRERRRGRAGGPHGALRRRHLPGLARRLRRIFRGEVEGTLVWPPRGELGFGYDPVFLPDGYDKTFGEMTAAGKARLEARRRRRAVAPRPRLPEIRPRKAGLGHERCANPASASTSIGRSARPSAPIATSTAMSATSRSTRSASPQPSRPSLRRCAPRTGPRQVTSIFLGGGTPSLMKPETVGAVLDAVAANWTVADRRRGHARGQPVLGRGVAFPRLPRGRRQPRLARRAGAERPRSAIPRPAAQCRGGAGRDRAGARDLSAAVLRPDLCAARPDGRKPGRPSSSRRSATPPTICRSTS